MTFVRSIVLGVLLLGGFGLFAHTTYWLYRNLRLGGEREMPLRLADRVHYFMVYVLGQSRVIREPAGILHFFIFWGFLFLQLETTEYFIRGFVWHFHFSSLFGEDIYSVLLFMQDMAGFVVFAACIIAGFRRYVLRPPHVHASADAAIILGLIGALMITKFMANGAEIAMAVPAELGHNPIWTPFAYATSFLIASGPGTAGPSLFARILYHGGYWIHIGLVLFFLNYIPFGKHLHLLAAMPNVFFRKLEPRGALYPLDMEDETLEKFGASEIEDLSWKQLLDMYACTECNRCETYCPAFNTGKALNPMAIVHNIKEHTREKGSWLLQRLGEGNGIDGQQITSAYSLDGAFPSLVGGVVTREELWACTTCGACVANCPVFIEHVDTIVDMRRHLTLMESDVSPEVARTFKNMENTSNPWGLSASYRADWVDAMDVPVPIMAEQEEPPEYLYFVGCAGSFDDRQKKVTESFTRILQEAGVSFAILGREEKCTGDAARRVGNEYLYQMMAKDNITMFDKYGITKVITTCPHCFHTIAKEYPQLGGNYEVIHHTDLIANLLREGRIAMHPGDGERIVYHDSCYIGRWDNNYDSPREIIDALPGTSRGEMELNKRQAFCCGAGGGQMWMEEDVGKRINLERTDQAIEAEPDTLAVACPFCLTMFDDGLKNRGVEDVRLQDLAEIVDEHMIRRPKLVESEDDDVTTAPA